VRRFTERTLLPRVKESEFQRMLQAIQGYYFVDFEDKMVTFLRKLKLYFRKIKQKERWGTKVIQHADYTLCQELLPSPQLLS
jgi:hypothetical protein